MIRLSFVSIAIIMLIGSLKSQSEADTLRIIQKENSTFQLDLQKMQSSNEIPTLVIIDAHGEIISILEWKYSVDQDSQVIRFPLEFYTNWFNQDFYSENFPSTTTDIDRTRHYNAISLGEIEGRLSKTGELSFTPLLIDPHYMQGVDIEKIRLAYDSTEVKDSIFDVECDNEKWQETYTLFTQITWATILFDTFSAKEYHRLERMILVCLGPEHGEDFLWYDRLIRLIK